MEFRTVFVTPEMAKEWLSRGGKNRAISKRQIDIIARAIKEDRWIETGDTISFGTDGRLQNGQHRLHAIIQAGIGVYLNICTGVDDPRAFEIYDRVLRRRTLGQVIDMEGGKEKGKHGNAIAAIARRLQLWEMTPLKYIYNVNGHYNNIIDDADILRYARDHMDEIAYYYIYMKNSKPFRQCGAGSALVAALVLCGRENKAVTTEFMDNLIRGVNLDADNPVWLLRERISDMRHKSGHEWETEIMALTIKAWNRYAADDSIKVLRWGQKEIFPMPGR